MANSMHLDEDAVLACTDLVGRTGAKEFQLGYLHDEPPHQWYAQAQYKGARIIEENHAGPSEAADALSRRLLTGADSWEAVAGQLAEASAASGVAMMLVIAPQIAVASVEEPWSIGDLTSD